MKNRQGFSAVAIIIILAILAGGGYAVWQKQTPASPIPSSITSPTSTTTNDILLPYSFPVIDSISPTSGPLGTEIKVFGKNMVDARGDQNVAIVNDKGEIAYFGFGDASFERTYLRVKVDSRICKKRGTDATLPCSSWMTVIPGKYYIFIDHNNFQGHFESNKIMFTILRGTTAVDTADWKTYRNEEYGFEFKYPVHLVGQDFSPPSISKRAQPDDEGTLASLSLIEPDKVRDSSTRLPSNATLELKINTRTMEEFDQWVKTYRSPIVNEINLGGQRGVQYITSLPSRTTPEIFTVVQKGQYIYELFVGHFGESSKEQINQYNQILSTFRFTK